MNLYAHLHTQSCKPCTALLTRPVGIVDVSLPCHQCFASTEQQFIAHQRKLHHTVGAIVNQGFNRRADAAVWAVHTSHNSLASAK